MNFQAEARILAEECFDGREIEEQLCEAVAQKIGFWMESAAQNQRNTDFYRELLQKCGELIGQEAYTADDGTLSDSVLCAKIPELVEALVNETIS